MPTYEIRVNRPDGFEIVKLEARSISEALDRARHIWCDVESTQLLCVVSHEKQECLAW